MNKKNYIDALEYVDVLIDCHKENYLNRRLGLLSIYEITKKALKDKIASFDETANGGWLDISTAPKDGTWILGYYSYGNHHHSQYKGGEQVAEGKHNCIAMYWDNRDLGDVKQTHPWHTFGESKHAEYQVSHWMPLPPCPVDNA